MRCLCLVAITLGLALNAQAQVPSPTFRSGVDLVALNVIVTDANDKFVTGLTQTDFAVFEDGVQQDVSFFGASNVPLDLAILLDTSASMTDKLETAQKAAIGLLSTLRDGDRVSVIDIKDATQILFPMGEDADGARQAILGTAARGGTALYNGTYLALKEMTKLRISSGEVRRQAIVVLSDGSDTTSLVSYEDVLETAKQSGIAIYTISLRSKSELVRSSHTSRPYFSQSDFAMKSLAQETGARSYFPTDISELSAIYSLIADELASQYALGYTSKNPKMDGSYRRVIVRVAERSAVRTRTRNGYLSSRSN